MKHVSAISTYTAISASLSMLSFRPIDAFSHSSTFSSLQPNSNYLSATSSTINSKTGPFGHHSSFLHSHNRNDSNTNTNIRSRSRTLSSLWMSASSAFPEGEWDERNSNNMDSSPSSPSSGGSFEQRHPINPPFSPSNKDSKTNSNKMNMKTNNAEHSMPLPPRAMSSQRKDRMNREKEVESKFLHGDDLIELREYIQNLESDLESAKEEYHAQNNNSGSHNKKERRLQAVQKALKEAKQMDAEQVYRSCLDMAHNLIDAGEPEAAKEWHDKAKEAKNCLPQYNLEGLWVGKYGEHGYEMINVTYYGDTLIATKVTGDKNVPKGEMTFKADLHPNAPGRSELEPIELSDGAASQWGHKHLPRFPGQGQVAAEGFVNNQFMEGQLILVGEYFSFAWVPIGHQIFFGRPSAELTMKMLKQSQMSDFGVMEQNEVENIGVGGGDNTIAEMRALAQRCLEETELLIYDEVGVEGELCFLSDDEYYFSQDGCFE